MKDHVLDFGYKGKFTLYLYEFPYDKGSEVQIHYAFKTQMGQTRPSHLKGICENEGETASFEFSSRLGGLDSKELRSLAKWVNEAADKMDKDKNNR